MTTLDERIQIRIPAGDGDDRVDGTFVTPGTMVPGVLFVHGWGGGQEQYLARAREIAALGCICLTFNLRGHSQTLPQYATVSRADNLADLAAAYDTLVARPHVDPSAIGVVGSSYGGYLAAILTTMRAVKWLGLRAPALYIDSGWTLPKLQLHKDQDLQAYRRGPVAASDNRALRACHDFAGDVLLVESADDNVVPGAVLKNYREACKHARSLTYRCIEGADHGLTHERDQRAYSTLLVNWMREMLAGARAGTVVPRSQEAEHGAAPESPPVEEH